MAAEGSDPDRRSSRPESTRLSIRLDSASSSRRRAQAFLDYFTYCGKVSGALCSVPMYYRYFGPPTVASFAGKSLIALSDRLDAHPSPRRGVSSRGYFSGDAAGAVSNRLHIASAAV